MSAPGRSSCLDSDALEPPIQVLRRAQDAKIPNAMLLDPSNLRSHPTRKGPRVTKRGRISPRTLSTMALVTLLCSQSATRLGHQAINDKAFGMSVALADKRTFERVNYDIMLAVNLLVSMVPLSMIITIVTKTYARRHRRLVEQGF